MDFNIFTTLYEKGKQYGLPVSVWYPIAMHESGGDPAAIGDGGTSYGLFQINKPSHPDFDIAKYKDPIYQADYQFPELVNFYKEGTGKGLAGVDLTKYVEKFGQRPVWNDETEKGIEKHYTTLMSFNPGNGMLTPPGLPPAIWKKDDKGNIVPSDPVQGAADAVKSFNPTGLVKDIATKAAFFIPAMILLALGAYLLFFGVVNKAGKDIIKEVIK